MQPISSFTQYIQQSTAQISLHFNQKQNPPNAIHQKPQTIKKSLQMAKQIKKKPQPREQKMKPQ